MSFRGSEQTDIHRNRRKKKERKRARCHCNALPLSTFHLLAFILSTSTTFIGENCSPHHIINPIKDKSTLRIYKCFAFVRSLVRSFGCWCIIQFTPHEYRRMLSKTWVICQCIILSWNHFTNTHTPSKQVQCTSEIWISWLWFVWFNNHKLSVECHFMSKVEKSTLKFKTNIQIANNPAKISMISESFHSKTQKYISIELIEFGGKREKTNYYYCISLIAFP